MRLVSLKKTIFLIIGLAMYINALAAPPIFNPIGDERYMNSILFVVEGNEIEFTVSAEDPDGDSLSYSALNIPAWANFNTTTGVFTGIAPYWSDDYETRLNQQNVYDITFQVTDGNYTVRKIVSIYVLDDEWTQKTMADVVAARPITAGGDFKTPLELSALTVSTITSSYGGGKSLQKVTFSYTTQVPAIEGWEDDWVSTINYVFLPLNTPAVQNAGAIVEGSYAQNFGDSELAERICAELDLPVLIIDRSWQFGHGGELMSKYDSLAVEMKDPGYLFYAFSTAHYLRSIDALITVIDSVTDWDVSYTDFKVVFTGHSKFGHTCHCAAAADPERVAGFMANGSSIIDTGASRLLGSLQGARGTKPEAFVNYLAVMMRYYVESLFIEDQMNPDAKALIIQGTDDDKDRGSGYTPKYILITADKQAALPHAIGCLANAPHTTQTQLHPIYWGMWVAYTLMGRPITKIDTVYHYFSGDNITVEAKISGATAVHKVVVWATEESDMDTSSWKGFSSYNMSFNGDVYKGEIPATSTTYFVEVKDEANGVKGLIASPPLPTNKDYPLLSLPPGDVTNFQAQATTGQIELTWDNPLDTDFAGVVICSSTINYPDSPLEGTLVYDGSETSTTHSTDANTVYYTAFTYDSLGYYSPGVQLKVEIATGITENNDALPHRFSLHQNYPNPFNPATTIFYELPITSKVQLLIFNSLGEEIKQLVNTIKSAGSYSVVWNGTDNSGKIVAAGVYFYQLKAGDNFLQTKKLIFLK